MSDEKVDQFSFGESIGRAFYGKTIADALQQAQVYDKDNDNKGHIASLPEIFHARVMSLENSFVCTNWFTAMSEEIVGTTQSGSKLLVVEHGGGIFSTHERIRKIERRGLINGAGRLSQRDFNNLLNGKLPDGKEIPVYSYADFIDQGNLPRKYGIILDFDRIKSIQSGLNDIDSLYENPLIIARAGGQEQAREYLDKVKQIYQEKDLRLYHPFQRVDASKAQGRVLFVGCEINFYGNSGLDADGRFIWVQKSAESGAKTLVHSLEKCLDLTDQPKTVCIVVSSQSLLYK